ncbi:NAD synthetase / Glutamine amidotransferase chain of NAD synthetase, partial [hydrothermal vent metagenome]
GMIYRAEYKRKQAAPGVKLTKKAFGFGRKYPITNGYRAFPE